VSTTAVNDEILRIHREEKVNLIATTLDTFPEAGLKISLTLSENLRNGKRFP
jgi:hypothetical protein